MAQTTVKVYCHNPNCRKLIPKLLTIVNRAQRLGINLYCSHKCRSQMPRPHQLGKVHNKKGKNGK